MNKLKLKRAFNEESESEQELIQEITNLDKFTSNLKTSQLLVIPLIRKNSNQPSKRILLSQSVDRRNSPEKFEPSENHSNSLKDNSDFILEQQALNEILNPILGITDKSITIPVLSSSNTNLSSSSTKLPLPSETQLFKEDMKHRPDGEETDYSKIPIEEFGAAMLRGMGWTGGLEVEKDELKNQFGSSRNEKGNKNVVVIESLIKPRLRLLGLGADTFANVLIQNNIITSSGRKDQEETRFKKKDQYDEGIRNNDAGFRGSNQNLNRKDRDDPAVKLETTNSRHDALSDSKRINIQSQVHIILGRHQGMRGSVINICQKEKGTVVSVEGTDKNNQKVVARVWIEDLRVVQ